ncbi:hypothetical protein IWX90DRAFT_248493 [Phyllosticta citrichinensis]|uniref:Uncharacterized protein n=1 Tax=Phyllosticta citrichinensis TaxID=1130410 RepID=A0ABR1XR31_9PEZI
MMWSKGAARCSTSIGCPSSAYSVSSRLLCTSSSKHPKHSVAVCINRWTLLGLSAHSSPVVSARKSKIVSNDRLHSSTTVSYTSLGPSFGQVNRASHRTSSCALRAATGTFAPAIDSAGEALERVQQESFEKRLTQALGRDNHKESQHHIDTASTSPRWSKSRRKLGNGPPEPQFAATKSLESQIVASGLERLFKTSSASWVSSVSRRLDTPFRRQRNSQGC